MTKNFPVAMPFRLNDNKIKTEYAELNVIFDKRKNDLNNFLTFVNEYPNTRINIEFINGIEYQLLEVLSKISDKIYVRLTISEMTRSTVEKLQEKQYRFFFDSTVPAYNYATLKSHISLGVSDVYIADDLCYSLENVREICDAHDVRIRLILNRIPSTTFDRGISYDSSIYRPQDIDLLRKYYDVFEFDCGRPYDWKKSDVLYRVWFQDKQWNGEMYEINDDLDFSFHNNSIIPEFTEYKINCNYRCGNRPHSICRKCEQFIQIGSLLKEKGVAFTRAKNRN